MAQSNTVKYLAVEIALRVCGSDFGCLSVSGRMCGLCHQVLTETLIFSCVWMSHSMHCKRWDFKENNGPDDNSDDLIKGDVHLVYM